MRHFLPVLSLAVLLLSLAACRKQVDPAQMAAVAAKGYSITPTPFPLPIAGSCWITPACLSPTSGRRTRASNAWR